MKMVSFNLATGQRTPLGPIIMGKPALWPQLALEPLGVIRLRESFRQHFVIFSSGTQHRSGVVRCRAIAFQNFPENGGVWIGVLR